MAGGDRADLLRRPADGVPDPPPDAHRAPRRVGRRGGVGAGLDRLRRELVRGAEPLPWSAHQALYRTLERYDGHVHYRRGLGGVPRLDVPRELAG